MTGVIYADVLFVINCYVTYALLLLTAYCGKYKINRLRMFFACLIGGASGLVVLTPLSSTQLMAVLRLILCPLLMLVSFRHKRPRMLIKSSLLFLSVNFVFAGIMLALWYFVNPAGLYFNSCVVYFDVSAAELMIITVVCYFILKAVSRLIRMKAPTNTIYDVTLFLLGQEITLRGFLDTGNFLADPFTGKDVIIVSRKALGRVFPEDKAISELMTQGCLKMRYLPCKSLSGSELIAVFKAEKIRIKGIGCDFTYDEPMIGLSEREIKNSDFQVLLPTGIFSNNYSDKGGNFNEDIRAY